MRFFAAFAAFTLCGLTAVAARAQTATFDFNAQTPGTSGPVVETNNGITATFDGVAAQIRSVSDIGPAPGLTPPFTGNLFADIGFFSIIDFSTPITSLSLDYVQQSIFFSGVSITAFSGGVEVFSNNTYVPGGMNNGFLVDRFSFFSPTPFDTAVIFAETIYGIDNVTAALGIIPEPGTVLLLASGLLPLVGITLRKRQRNRRA